MGFWIGQMDNLVGQLVEKGRRIEQLEAELRRHGIPVPEAPGGEG